MNKSLRIPCKIGDILYTNMYINGDYLRNSQKPYVCEVVHIGINKEYKDCFINVVIKNTNTSMLQFKFSDIGKAVFLSKEEAERELMR